MNNEELDNLFKKELNQSQVSPPDALWDRIEQELNQAKPTPVKTLGWLKYAAVLAFFLSLAVAIYLYRGTIKPAEKEISAYHSQEQPSHPSPATEETNSTAQHQQVVTSRTDQKQAYDRSALQKSESLPPSVSAVRTSRTTPEEEPRPTVHIDEILTETSLLQLTQNTKHDSIPTYRVVEIDPIAPLIEDPEQEDSMLAKSPINEDNALPAVIGKILEQVYPEDNKSPIRFSKDEEGSIQIDFKNFFAKNRAKKRK